MDVVAQIMTAAVEVLASWGYLGLFIIMALESSLIPIPSEVVMIPAGYLVSQGRMSLWVVIFVSTLGSLAGALFNYYIAYFLGRSFFERFGKYIGIKVEHMEKVETYFHKHGSLSTFVGRLTPVIRQLISLPAGFARMNVFALALYTSIGAGIWNGVLITIGFLAGQNKHLQEKLLGEMTIYVVVAIVVVVAAYVLFQKYSKKIEHTILILGELAQVISNMQKTIVVSSHAKIKAKDIIVTEDALGKRIYWNILQQYKYSQELLLSLLDALCRSECSTAELSILASQYTDGQRASIYVLKRKEG